MKGLREHKLTKCTHGNVLEVMKYGSAVKYELMIWMIVFQANFHLLYYLS